MSHICLSLCEYMQSEDLEVVLVVPSSETAGRRSFTRDAVPSRAARWAYRLGKVAPRTSAAILATRVCTTFREAMSSADAVYLWPGVPLDIYAEAKARCLPLVMERINCHRRTARPILQAAYARLGLSGQPGMSESEMILEDKKLALADFVIAPSAQVADSLLDAGVPASKVLNGSYGWDPARVSKRPSPGRGEAGLRVLFVGSLSVRKGVHVLLEAWARSGLCGELLLAGQLSPEIAATCRDLLQAPGVRHLGYIGDVASAYAQADIFALPSLEEGSPLVTYEAMGYGLPVIVSPMAAGGIVHHGVDGLVVDSRDGHGWVSALRTLAADPGRRRELGATAAASAQRYTWPKVATRRREMLFEALQWRTTGFTSSTPWMMRRSGGAAPR